MGWVDTDLSSDWSINDGTFDTDHIDAENVSGTTWEVDVVYVGSEDMSDCTKIKITHDFGATGLTLYAWWGAGIWDDTSNYVSATEWEWSDKDLNRFLTQGLNSTYAVSKIELYFPPSGTYDFDMTIPSAVGLINPNVFEMSVPGMDMESFSASNIIAEIPSTTLSCDATNTMLADIEGTIPPIFFTASTSASETRDDFDMEIPSLSLEAFSAGGINIELPEVLMELEGKTGKLADINIILPSMSMIAKMGAAIKAKIPKITFEADATHSTYLAGLTGNIILTIPSPRVRIVSVPDDAIEAEIPMLTMSAAVQQPGNNSLNLSIPSLIMSVKSGTIFDDALRYIRGKIR